MEFKTKHTPYGLARMQAAEVTGMSINLTHVAVGDGGGTVPEIRDGVTGIVREKYRAAINRVYQNPRQANHYTIEFIIPLDKGGFVLREAAVIDDQGSTVAVASVPPAYLPSQGEGAFTDAVLSLELQTSNADVVTIIVDPAVAVATQRWVINNFTPAVLFPGGLANQYLAKRSNQPGDTEWRDFDAVNIVVDTIEEPQLLAQGQRRVDLHITTTNSLSVYVDGRRLPRGLGPGNWMPDEEHPFTSILLGSEYPEGTVILLAQNDPMGSATEPLAKSQNLADVLDKRLARENLDIFSREESRQLAPVGLLGLFRRASAPPGWLKANGAAVSRTAYADLFAEIGTSEGEGDGVTTFNLPDWRGEFFRGWDDGRRVDSGRALGGRQGSGLGSHSHSASVSSAGAHTHSLGGYVGRNIDDAGIRGSLNVGTATSNATNSAGAHTHTVTVDSAGGGETRPRNVALLACIKY